MATDLTQQIAATGLYDAESIRAFNQMYNAQNPYGAAGFDKNYQAAFPFFAQHFAPYANPNATSAFSPSSSSTSSTSSQQQHPSKKKPVPVPKEQKDDAYYDRRRRNNEAARKSREARRKQDTDNSVRVAELERENQWLKACIFRLTQENAQMAQRVGQQFPGFGLDPSAAANIPSY